MKHWLGVPAVEVLFILLPPFASTAAALLFPSRGISLADWLMLVVFVDVAHVYSTLFRSYFDGAERRERGLLLVLVPAACYICGVALYAAGSAVFWRVLAYVAVFHFVRQQYGLMRLYARDEEVTRTDAAMIYAACGYPLLYWHTHEREFNWFLEGDFLAFDASAAGTAAAIAYAGIIAAYLYQELRRLRAGTFHVQKNAVVLGTALSWYCGIVFLNGDFAFTVTNILTHGIPYMALVYLHGRSRRTLSGLWIAAALVFLAALAYTEEMFWDVLVWKDKPVLFPLAAQYYSLIPRGTALVFLVPLLALPQATHYVLDGFIWKIRGSSTRWKSVWRASSNDIRQSTGPQ